MELELNKEYTIISMNSMAMTSKIEGIIVAIEENTGYEDQYLKLTFKQRGKRKLVYFSPKTKNTLIFRGYDLPLKVNSEFNHFSGNALINLVGFDSSEIKLYVEEKNLNPSIDKAIIVCWKRLSEKDYSADEKEVSILYPELAKASGHAILNRLLEKQGIKEHAMSQADIERLRYGEKND
jgi:hypothetical protein